MGNKTEEKVKKVGRRKIRIRLADPNIPDSYICEIFDSSLENEDESGHKEESFDKILNCEDENLKPKNFFEVLMSNESRSYSAARENEKTSENSKILKAAKDEDTSKKKKYNRQKNNKALIELSKNKTKNNGFGAESSDEESLFEMQKKVKLSNRVANKERILDDVDEELVDITDDNDLEHKFESPKHKLSEKKTLSILNFLSKVEIPKEKIFSRTQKDSHKKSLPRNGVLKNIKSIKSESNSSKIGLRKSFININKENVKLAPLFQNKKKPVVDITAQKARHDFLFKGLPSVVKKSENVKYLENLVTFPSISHVQQRNENVCWSIRKINFPVSTHSYIEKNTCESNKRFRLHIKQLKAGITTRNCDTKINKKSFSELRSKYLNSGSIIDRLKEKRDKFEKRIKEIEKNFLISNDESSLEIFNTLWIDKYKPKSDEILGNEKTVKRIRKWLETWKTFDQELKLLAKSERIIKKKEKSDDDESDYFLQSDDENFGLKMPENVCLLSGPNGCGKTSLIYALASELEFNVLEVNASSYRTGKRVLSELQEATQSHKVHRVNITLNEELKVDTKKRSKKRKRKKKSEPTVEVLDQANDCKISLILIEDADIVFEEHDEGFFSAIASLVQNSKRPIVFLTNDSDRSYLENFKTDQCLVFEMEHPNFYKSLVVLDTVSFLENGHIDTCSLQNLLRQNHFDLRKCLLDLQLWIQSGDLNLTPQFDIGHFWWGLPKFLYDQEMKHPTKRNAQKRKRSNDFFNSSDEEDAIPLKILKSHSWDLKLEPTKQDQKLLFCYSFLNLGSTLDSFLLPTNQEPIPGFLYKAKDSLSLNENMEEVPSASNNLLETISKEMMSLSTRVFSKISKDAKSEQKILNLVPPSWEEVRWRKCQEKATKELSTLVPLSNGQEAKSVHLDYLPALRGICRIERNRWTLNTKRKNRFNHYLNNLGLQLTSENLETNCQVFEL